MHSVSAFKNYKVQLVLTMEGLKVLSEERRGAEGGERAVAPPRIGSGELPPEKNLNKIVKPCSRQSTASG